MDLNEQEARKIDGPGTMDGIGPSGDWERYWREVDAQRRSGAPWAEITSQNVTARRVTREN
jgi:hypothetical protein